MALQPFVGPWPLFSFLILYTVGRAPWTGDQPIARYRINAHNTDIHAFSGIRTHDSSFRESEDSSCLTPRGHCEGLEGSLPCQKNKSLKPGPPTLYVSKMPFNNNFRSVSWSPKRSLPLRFTDKKFLCVCLFALACYTSVHLIVLLCHVYITLKE
jgi:hypothetical protein